MKAKPKHVWLVAYGATSDPGNGPIVSSVCATKKTAIYERCMLKERIRRKVYIIKKEVKP